MRDQETDSARKNKKNSARKVLPEAPLNSQDGVITQSASEIRLRRQNEMLVKLTRDCCLDGNDIITGLRKITEGAARTLEVERVGVWMYNETHSKIQCVDLYEQSPDRHSEGDELTAATYPSYFKALEEERAIAAHDARRDFRTKEYLESYLSPLGITSMLDAPIRVGGRIVGIICHEHVGPARRWALDEQNFAGSMADIVSLVIHEGNRKQAEKEIEKSVSLLQATFESTADGILAVDHDGKMVSLNQKFVEMFGVPDSVIESREAKDGLTIAKEKFKDPEGFIKRVGELYNQPEVESYDILELKDGRRIERYSQPQRIGGKSVGRVWSFRDVTERRRAEMALLKSERKYRTLVENSPDVILNIDRRGKILFINHTLPQFTVEGVIGTNVTQYIPPEQAVVYIDKIQKLFDTGVPQFIVLDSVGEKRWQSRLIPIIQEGKVETALVIASDITDQERGARELETSVSLLRATLESTADGILVVNNEGEIVAYNQKFVEMWQIPDSILTSGDLKQARVFAMNQLKDPEGFIKKLEDLYSQPDAIQFDILEFKDGRVVERYSQPQRIGGKSVGRVWSFRDITERKRSEIALQKILDGLETRVEKRTAELSNANRDLQEQVAERKRAEHALQEALKKLQQLSHHILQIQENEYQFISRELHDNIAQSINAVKMGLERLDLRATPGPSELQKDIRTAVAQLKEISQAVRKLSKQKRPEILDELGLTATLDSYIKDFRKLTGIQARFVNKTILKLIPPNLAVHLYRIVQESLNNIAQHARATHAVVRLEDVGKTLHLSIKDNGVGFSSLPSGKGGKGLPGIGLISIQERASLLSGSLEITSSHGKGTKISVTVPIEP